jgi:hypothetical protein
VQRIEAAAQPNFLSIFFGAGNASTTRYATFTEFDDGHPHIVRVVQNSGYAAPSPTSTVARAAPTPIDPRPHPRFGFDDGPICPFGVSGRFQELLSNYGLVRREKFRVDPK